MRGRNIRGNKTTSTPNLHVAVDTETTPLTDAKGWQHHRLMLGHAVCWRTEGERQHSRSEYTFMHVDDFWEFLESCTSTYRTLWIWAHNSGFDATILRLWDRIEIGNVKVDFLCDRCPPFILCGSINGHKIVWCDTLNFFRRPLKDIGEWVEHPKLDAPGQAAELDDWAVYCRRDTEIVELAVKKLCKIIREHDMGVMKYTSAGVAFQHWRHRFRNEHVTPPPVERECKLARDCYYGGSVEVFFRGNVFDPAIYHGRDATPNTEGLPSIADGPVYILDVNSCYGHVMRQNTFPTRLVHYTEKASVADLELATDHYLVCAEVAVETTQPMPFRVNGVGTIFATGKFDACLCTPEITTLLALGQVVSVKRMAVYQHDNIMHHYAGYWLDMRAAYKASGDRLMEEFAKSMLNSLYGKWGQKTGNWQPANDPPDDYPSYGHFIRRMSDGSLVEYRTRLGQVEVLVEQTETPFSFPAIAAHCTAYARRGMDRMVGIAGEHNVFYQCCDSIHVNGKGLYNLRSAGCVDNDTPGSLKVARVCDDIVYYAINCVQEGSQLRCSGISRSARLSSDGFYESPDFEPIDSILSRQPDGTVRVAVQRLRPNRSYLHRLIQPSGWTKARELPRDLPDVPSCGNSVSKGIPPMDETDESSEPA